MSLVALQRRVARLEKERCLLIQAEVPATAKPSILRALSHLFSIAALPPTKRIWRENEEGKFSLQDIGEAWTAEDVAEFTTLKERFMSIWSELPPEFVEYCNMRSNNWVELVLHQGTLTGQLLDLVRSHTHNPFKRFGVLSPKVKVKGLRRQQGGDVAESEGGVAGASEAGKGGKGGKGKGGKKGAGKTRKNKANGSKK